MPTWLGCRLQLGAGTRKPVHARHVGVQVARAMQPAAMPGGGHLMGRPLHPSPRCRLNSPVPLDEP
eukprot:5623014-Alexandrium_andersonii.AAC.1